MLVFSTQECERAIWASAFNTSKARWEKSLQAVLSADSASDGSSTSCYQLVASHTLQATHVAVFAHRAVVPLISDVSSQAVACGTANTVGNKGAICVGICLGNTSLLMIGCHLAAGHSAGAAAARLANIEHIERTCTLAPPDFGIDGDSGAASIAPVPAFSGTDAAPERKTRVSAAVARLPFLDPLVASNRFDRTIWLGDVNSRCSTTRSFADACIQEGRQADLLGKDELRAKLRECATMQGFGEGPLRFRPTYKLGRASLARVLAEGLVTAEPLAAEELAAAAALGGSAPLTRAGASEEAMVDVYDPSKKRRVQSWTDRILVKPANAHCRVLAYRSLTRESLSDHRPVTAALRIVLRAKGSRAADLLEGLPFWFTPARSAGAEAAVTASAAAVTASAAFVTASAAAAAGSAASLAGSAATLAGSAADGMSPAAESGGPAWKLATGDDGDATGAVAVVPALDSSYLARVVREEELAASDAAVAPRVAEQEAVPAGPAVGVAGVAIAQQAAPASRGRGQVSKISVVEWHARKPSAAVGSKQSQVCAVM